MKIEITEKAIKYLEKKDAKDLVIHMIANDTGGGWGSCGSTRRYYKPSIKIDFNNNIEKKGYDQYEVNGIRVFFPSKIKLDKNQNIVIDTEKIFFIEKLALNGLDTIWVD